MQEPLGDADRTYVLDRHPATFHGMSRANAIDRAVPLLASGYDPPGSLAVFDADLVTKDN